MLDTVLNAFMLVEKIASILHDTGASAISRLTTNGKQFTPAKISQIVHFDSNT
jgi:hypothetical protein